MLERTIYGVEYDPRQQPKEPSGLRWLIVIVIVATLASLGVSIVKRITTNEDEGVDDVVVAVSDDPVSPPAVTTTESAQEKPATAQPAAPTNISPSVVTPPPPPTTIRTSVENRPLVVRNLLMRLEEANRRRDIQMQVTTIEQLRAQPGAADLDDTLARRLGVLNMRKLFELKSREWVEKVEVKRGDSASRIASEHGSTFASFAKLNNGKVDRIILGSKLYVLSRPKFSLTLHRRLRCADLLLNGKFFKRYDLTSDPKTRNGVYEWSAVGSALPLSEHKELDMLLPRSTVTVVTEL